MKPSFAGLRDPRIKEQSLSNKDAVVSAHGQSIFGAKRIPRDTQVGNLLIEQEPEQMDGVFEKGHELLVS